MLLVGFLRLQLRQSMRLLRYQAYFIPTCCHVSGNYIIAINKKLVLSFFFQAARGKHFYEKEELHDLFSAYIYIFFLNFYINHFSNSGRAFHTMTTEVNVLNSCLG